MATRTGAWDLNAPSEGVTGYKLYLDGAAVGTVGPTIRTYTFANVPNGTRIFGVSALVSSNPAGEDESDLATITQKVTGKPSKPLNFVLA